MCPIKKEWGYNIIINFFCYSLTTFFIFNIFRISDGECKIVSYYNSDAVFFPLPIDGLLDVNEPKKLIQTVDHEPEPDKSTLILNTVADYSDSRAIYSKVYWVGLMSCFYALKFMEIHIESLALTSLVEGIAIDMVSY